MVDKKKSYKRRTGPGEHLHVLVPIGLVKKAKAKALIEDRTLSDAVTEAVERWVSGGALDDCEGGR